MMLSFYRKPLYNCIADFLYICIHFVCWLVELRDVDCSTSKVKMMQLGPCNDIYIGCKTGLNRFNDICNHLTLTHDIYYTLHNFSNSYILSASDCINTLQIYSLNTIKFLYITIYVDCHLTQVLCYCIHKILKCVISSHVAWYIPDEIVLITDV